MFDIPASANLSTRKLAYFQKADELVFAESDTTIRTLLKHLSSDDATDTLANQAGYQEVIKQCQQRAGGESPDAVVFLARMFGVMFCVGLAWAVIGDLIMLPAILACFPPNRSEQTGKLAEPVG